jgi:hypothetical protein
MKFRSPLSLIALLALAVPTGCNRTPETSNETDRTSDDRGMPMPQSGEAVKVSTGVDADAVEALKDMSGYLMSMKTAGIHSDGSLDVVTEDGQRIQLDGTTDYKIRRPGFVIDYKSDIKNRRFIYDGKTFTVDSPTLGYYASVAAPPTNREVLDTIYNKFGIRLPLEDLFRWNDPGGLREQSLKAGYFVGSATIDGVKTDHYAFREEPVDWQVWIQQGEQPLPRKLVIVDKTDPARPTFTARLDWRLNPTFSNADFAFAPGKDAKRIPIATFKGSGE